MFWHWLTKLSNPYRYAPFVGNKHTRSPYRASSVVSSVYVQLRVFNHENLVAHVVQCIMGALTCSVGNIHSIYGRHWSLNPWNYPNIITGRIVLAQNYKTVPSCRFISWHRIQSSLLFCIHKWTALKEYLLRLSQRFPFHELFIYSLAGTFGSTSLQYLCFMYIQYLDLPCGMFIERSIVASEIIHVHFTIKVVLLRSSSWISLAKWCCRFHWECKSRA